VSSSQFRVYRSPNRTSDSYLSGSELLQKESVDVVHGTPHDRLHLGIADPGIARLAGTRGTWPFRMGIFNGSISECQSDDCFRLSGHLPAVGFALHRVDCDAHRATKPDAFPNSSDNPRQLEAHFYAESEIKMRGVATPS